jgi:hypothetical protein
VWPCRDVVIKLVHSTRRDPESENLFELAAAAASTMNEEVVLNQLTRLLE